MPIRIESEPDLIPVAKRVRHALAKVEIDPGLEARLRIFKRTPAKGATTTTKPATSVEWPEDLAAAEGEGR